METKARGSYNLYKHSWVRTDELREMVIKLVKKLRKLHNHPGCSFSFNVSAGYPDLEEIAPLVFTEQALMKFFNLIEKDIK